MSEQYIVSARKYRPQTFDTVIGQEHITTTLKNAIKNEHLAHAYLFTGPRGVGKTTCARILAKTINCTNVTADTEACGTCDNCINSSENSSFNIFELDAASNNSVDGIRALTEQVRFAPQMGKYKVYIIDEVHMLSSNAFNAFLKTLEEPPSYAIFILATTEKHKILPTILSRCQIFDFKRIQTQDTVAHLQQIADKEGIHAEETALHIIASQSEGCMRDALSIMDRIVSFSNGHLTYSSTIEHLNMLDAHTYFDMTDWLIASDYQSVLLTIEDLLSRGFEGNMILAGLADHFRNLLLSKDIRMAKLLDIAADHKKTYFEKAQIIPESFLMSALKIVGDAELQYTNASNKRLHLELCMIKLAHLKDTIQLTQFLQAEEIKKKISQLLNEHKDSASIKATLDSWIGDTVIPSSEINEPSHASVQEEAPALNTSSIRAISDEGNTTEGTLVTEKISPPVSSSEHTSVGINSQELAQATHSIASQDTESSLTREQKPAPSRAKLGKDFLSRVRSKNQEQAEEEKDTIPLDDVLLQSLFRNFLADLAEGKELLRRQIAELPFTVKDHKTITVKVPTQLQLNAVISIIPSLLERIAVATHNPSIRIIPSLDVEDEDGERKVKSKQDIFEYMKQSNPGLMALAEHLALRPTILREFPKQKEQLVLEDNTKKYATLDDAATLTVEDEEAEE